MPDPIGVSVSGFRERLASLGYPSYSDFLASPHWLEMRQRHRADVCAFCKKKDGLHLHHTSYERLGGEDASDFLTVCELHHREIHDYANARGVTVATATVAIRFRYRKIQQRRKDKQFNKRQAKKTRKWHSRQPKPVGGNADPFAGVKQKPRATKQIHDASPERVKKYGGYLAKQPRSL